MPTGRWVGPLSSAYGDHLVRVSARTHVVPAIDPEQARIARQIEAEEQRLQLALAELRERYRWAIGTHGETQR